MFFRKKRYSDVEGYDRISRRIEDMRAGPGDEGEDDEALFDDEDTVLLAREPRDTNARDAAPYRPPAGREAAPGRGQPLAEPDDEIEESVTVVRPPERTTAREPSPTVTPAEPPATMFAPPAVEPPRMPAPDVSLAPGQAGTASLVARDAVWEGKLVGSGDVRIEGTLRGELETNGTLVVAPEARVEGSVRARNVRLAGEIHGDLRCEERLEILPGGAARGEVDTGTLVVHEGAYIESRFQMRREAAAAR